jgi:ectoine hydroxylase-related dioxygenase (phytanoyl-CoA dioxygenase family)
VDEAAEPIDFAEIDRGDVTVHNEYVVHGSGGNTTSGWRRTYVVAYRTQDTVRQERAAGFTHSHRDTVNWDTFNKWK